MEAPPAQGELIHHSDRGVQYASQAFRRLLKAHGIEGSMSGKGDYWDNAVVESFFGSLKSERVHWRSYQSREKARAHEACRKGYTALYLRLPPLVRTMQILILGMHRSGTSMLTRLVSMMGAYFGPESLATAANNENPKGFWERRDIRKLNDALLHSAGADWHRIADYDPTRLSQDTMARFEKDARTVILGMDAHRPWVIKEPRLCLNLPAWLPLLLCPVCLISVRNPIEIARSLQVRNGIPIGVGIALSQTYYRRVLRATDHLPRAIISHRALVSDPTAEVRRIHDRLAEFGIKQLHIPSDADVEELIDPHLYRQRGSNGLTRTHLTAAQSDFFAALGVADWSSLARMLEDPAPELELLRLFETGVENDARIKALTRERQLLAEERDRLMSANEIVLVNHFPPHPTKNAQCAWNRA